LIVINPIYLFTGPFPQSISFETKKFKSRFKKRFIVVSNDLIIGLFFISTLSPTLSQFLILKDSKSVIDIVAFSFALEIYIYINFCGYSILAWGLMRMLGIKVIKNFNQPFSSINVVDYWQRWHLSLSQILRELFFNKVKKTGIVFSVFVTFMASAMWHGISINYLMWGLFQAILWLLTWKLYKYSNTKIVNYLLLIVSIVIGRLFFSEIDITVIFEKLNTLFSISKWTTYSVIPLIKPAPKELLNLVCVLVILIIEIFLGRSGVIYQKYNYLKHPVISTLLLIYTLLFLQNVFVMPVYGIR
jgi:D-alanyl-lipoteichoic acid acyltransferase DltB (MBOAT superfamily)